MLDVPLPMGVILLLDVPLAVSVPLIDSMALPVRVTLILSVPLADCDGVTELVIVVNIVTDDVAEIAAPEIVTLRI